jgi:hypothetical protein
VKFVDKIVYEAVFYYLIVQNYKSDTFYSFIRKFVIHIESNMDKSRPAYPPNHVLSLPESEKWSEIPVVVEGLGLFVGNVESFQYEFNPKFAGNKEQTTPIYPDPITPNAIVVRNLLGVYPGALTYDRAINKARYVCVATYETNKSTSHSKYYVN